MFSWHVKGLFSLGYATAWSLPEQLGCELLQLTWFFSSLYLCALYVGLVLTSGLRGLSLRAVWRFTLRGVFQRATALRWRGAALFRSTLTLTPTFVALMWFAFLFLVYAPLSFGVVYVDLSFFDNSAFSVVSYY